MSLESNVRALGVQIRNAADSISTAQTADGEAAVITDVLQRMNELAVQAQGTNGSAQASKIQVEFSALNAFQAAFTDGTSVAGSLAGSGSAVGISSNIGTALGALAGTRAGYGATISTAEFTIQNYEVARENNAAARSRIMDADFAMETANLARGQILVQAGTAMVAQANSIPQNVLSLLR
jgi:flagellin